MNTTGKPTLLVVEDDLDLRKILVQLFAEQYYVVEAEDGKKAIELTLEERPSTILLDLMLPEVDGFGVLTSIRSNPDHFIAKTPVVVLSNLWTNQDILRAESLTVEAYFVKAHTDLADIEKKVAEITRYNN